MSGAVSGWASAMALAALAVDRAAFGLAEQADRDLVFAVGEIVRGLPEPEGWAEARGAQAGGETSGV